MNRSTCWLFFICAFALIAAPAFAGPLATDPSTYQSGFWSGSTGFLGVDPNNNNAPTGLTGNVDWAVWAPGTFPVGFAGHLGWAPTPGEFVYAYQVHETGSLLFSQLKVSLLNIADNIGSFSGNGGNGLVAGDFPSTFVTPFLNPFNSATWTFDGIVTGGSSSGLAFSSPNVPMFVPASVLDHGSSANVFPVPSPGEGIAPEPATLTLAGSASAMLALAWLRRRLRKVC